MKFTPDMFATYLRFHSDPEFWSGICDIANAKLAEWLEKAPVIRKEWESYKWVEEALEDKFITHKARLVCIEEIK